MSICEAYPGVVLRTHTARPEAHLNSPGQDGGTATDARARRRVVGPAVLVVASWCSRAPCTIEGRSRRETIDPAPSKEIEGQKRTRSTTSGPGALVPWRGSRLRSRPRQQVAH